MAFSSRITELAASISSNTAIVNKYLQDNNLPQLSFDADVRAFDAPFPREVEHARRAIADASVELGELVAGPKDLLHQGAAKHTPALDVIYRLDIPPKVPVDNPTGTSFASLSEQTGVDQNALTRVLRQAIAHRIFTEPRVGFIAHSAASKLMAEDAGTWNVVGARTEDVGGCLSHLGKALVRWPAANEPTQTAASLYLANGEPLTFFEGLAKESKRVERFAQAMKFFEQSDAFSLQHLVDGYDWGSLPADAKVVDMGGSHGGASIAVAKEWPKLHFVVQDLAQTIESAPSPPSGLRIEFQVHDFFQPQKVKGAAVYFMRQILHNWPDQYCVRILQALIPALEKGARILLMDSVMPAVGKFPSNAVERTFRERDVSMLSLCNSGDREAEGYQALFKKADKRFRFLGIKSIEGSLMSLIEAEWEGEEMF